MVEIVLEATDDQGGLILTRLDERIGQLDGVLLIARSGPRSRTYTCISWRQTEAAIAHELRDIAPGWEAHVTLRVSG
jgi:hypothetical protein